MSLTRDQIFAVDENKLKTVNVPEWGGDVFVKIITAKEREQLELAYIDKTITNTDQKVLYVIMGCADASGKQLFSLDDAEMLKTKSMVAIDRIHLAVLDYNFISPAAVEVEKKD